MPASTESIDLHVRSYRSALKSTLEVTIHSLSNSHLHMEPILHALANDPTTFDTAAFIYSVFRLPVAIDRTHKIIVGQNSDVFAAAGFTHVDSWKKVSSPARRRTNRYYPPKKLLAVFAASISDIDDITNLLIAYQTEWNKLHDILLTHYKSYLSFKKDFDNLPKLLEINPNDWQNLIEALGINWKLRLRRIYKHRLDLRIQLLAGSWLDYTRTTQKWWKNIARTVDPHLHMSKQEIYFVSSNLHSLLNIFTGFALRHQHRLLQLLKIDRPKLHDLWLKIQSKESFLDPIDFLYFISKYYLATPEFKDEHQSLQQKLNIIPIPSAHYLDVNVQIFPLKNLLYSPHLDPRLKISRPQVLSQSNALILNIDYPLGFASYHVLSETMENVQKIKGVYVLGKAAVLNGEIGDIQIPRLVFDEHTQNTYIFKNCFNTFFPFTNHQGSILTHQKSASVLGTFLENQALLEVYSKNNLTVIEMESGPFLNAVTESTYDQQTPHNTIIDLNNAPFDLGIINYTSDTPYSKAKNLGSNRLTLDGIEPVYLGTLAILQRIINLEEGST